VSSAIPHQVTCQVGARFATGYLHLEPETLCFSCLVDEPVREYRPPRSSGGLALLAASTALRSAEQDRVLKARYAVHHQLPLEARMRQHPLSRAIARTQVKELRIGPDVWPTHRRGRLLGGTLASS
jgi:hypothetical protein